MSPNAPERNDARAAFQDLPMKGGPFEVALFKAIGTVGASGVSDALGVDEHLVRQWVFRCHVPEAFGEPLQALAKKVGARLRRGQRSTMKDDPRKARLAALLGLSVRARARILGVGTGTVSRWTHELLSKRPEAA